MDTGDLIQNYHIFHIPGLDKNISPLMESNVHFYLVITNLKSRNLYISHRSENTLMILYVTGKMRKLKELMLKGDNRICADCSAPDPKWA